MRAITTTALLPVPNHVLTRNVAIPAPRRRVLGRLFSRRQRQPTLFLRCLAVHMATAGTLSALR
jgi:hypothetical protein